ncbi:hypothetical protein L204_101479 [Cryptococcus depauperatus]
MLYILGLLVLLLIILVIWLVRMAILYIHRKRGENPVPVDPEAQFRQVADRVFSITIPRTSQSRAELSNGRCRGQVRVARPASESEASLPAYGAESFPVPPERVYQPAQLSIRPDHTTEILAGVSEPPPPKYSSDVNENNFIPKHIT